MPRSIPLAVLAAGLLLAAGFGRASAQVSLADDIILATQGKENAERSQRSKLGHKPGTISSPFRRSPGSSDIMLGVDPNRRLEPLSRLSRRLVDPTAYQPPGRDQGEPEQGLAPAIERLRIPDPIPRAGLTGSPGGPPDEVPGMEGPPTGLTLDAAIGRFVHANRDLRTKFLELPQAEADIVTAGLLSNPLLFYSSGSVPYGSYSRNRPGDIDHGVSIVYPIDFSGKRRSRVAVASKEKEILGAQYQDAVRHGIDDLYTAYVDALAARQAVRTAELSLGLHDQLLGVIDSRAPRRPEDQDDRDDLTIERDLTAMSVGDERERFEKAKSRLGGLLDLSPEEVEHLELRGGLRVEVPDPPTADAMIRVAMAHRPDLIAHRLGVERACAMLKQERAEKFSDAYFLYTPFEYRDNSQTGDRSISTWGAGVFVSAPLFNRNQGNLRRAELNIAQSRIEAGTMERKVVAEVRQAVRDFENSGGDLSRLETVTLPAVRRKRDKAWSRLRDRTITAEAFLAVQRDTTSLVRYYRDTVTRHRRNTLKLNTAVGARVLPLTKGFRAGKYGGMDAMGSARFRTSSRPAFAA